MTLAVWRIGHASVIQLADLGFGSTLADGRWHIGCSGARQMVYCGASRALCQLEKRVHCNGAAPKNMVMHRLEIPSTAKLLQSADLGLPADWRDNQAATQQWGMRWLVDGASLGMWVPSYVEPAELNLLLNPAHAAYTKIKLVVEHSPFMFDPRLFG